ncbi:MAG: radical SAM/SPASM domain-containing protein, partial [Bryobacteraceae bacterium]
MRNGLLADTWSKLNLLRGLLDGERAYVGPRYVTFDMTTRCNSICRGCLYHCSETRKTTVENEVTEDLPLELIQRVAPELAQSGTKEVMLSGEGEPLLHPRFDQIVSAFKRAGLIVRSFTNGTLLDEATAQRIVRTGLDELCPTFWAVNRQEHLAWHPGLNPDFLERRKRGIEFVRRAREYARQSLPRITLQLPLNRSNFGNIEGRVRLALESGCESVSFGVFRDYGGPFESECLLPVDGESMRADMMRATEQLDRAGIRHNVAGYLDRLRYGGDAWRTCPCYAGWFQSYVKLDGSVLACCRCRLMMGNLGEQSFAEVWNSAAYRDFRRRSVDLRQLAAMGEDCNCSNCCYWHDNRRVHAVWRRLAPP